jgi:hypothetical protein
MIKIKGDNMGKAKDSVLLVKEEKTLEKQHEMQK